MKIKIDEAQNQQHRGVRDETQMIIESSSKEAECTLEANHTQAKRTTKLQESTTTTGIKHTSETQALIQNQETAKIDFQTHSRQAICKARMHASEGKTTNRAHHNAPYCITMQLTPDYGRRAKGKPEAPKAQTPHYCTGQRPCEQITHSTQRVQGSPFNNR